METARMEQNLTAIQKTTGRMEVLEPNMVICRIPAQAVWEAAEDQELLIVELLGGKVLDMAEMEDMLRISLQLLDRMAMEEAEVPVV